VHVLEDINPLDSNILCFVTVGTVGGGISNLAENLWDGVAIKLYDVGVDLSGPDSQNLNFRPVVWLPFPEPKTYNLF
jgi:hypothetical protein